MHWKMKNCYAEDIFKTFSKTRNMFAGIAYSHVSLKWSYHFKDSDLSTSNSIFLSLEKFFNDSNSPLPGLPDLDCLSSSAITTCFNCSCGRLNFCNFTLRFSLKLIRYSFFQRSQKWFRVLMVFPEQIIKSVGVYDI